MTSGRSSNCYRDDINDANDNKVANNRTNNNKTITSKSFKYMTKLKGTTTTVIISLHKKTYFLFPNVLKDGLSEKIALEYDLSCISRKNGIFFSKKYFSFGREVKDAFSQEIHGNMIFFVCMYKCYKYGVTLLQKKIKDDLFPKKYI